jgi:hypothetical protein
MERINITRAEGMNSYRLSKQITKLDSKGFSAHKGLSWRAIRAVLRVLADHYPNVYPSVKVIAKETGLGETQTKKALRALEADGYISDISGKKGGQHNSVQYILDVAKICNPTVCAEFGLDQPGILEETTRQSVTANPTVSVAEPDSMCRGTENRTEKANREDKQRSLARSQETSSHHKLEILIQTALSNAVTSPTILSSHKKQLEAMILSFSWTEQELIRIVKGYVSQLDEFQCRHLGDLLVTSLPGLMANHRRTVAIEADQKEFLASQTALAQQRVQETLAKLKEDELIEEFL